MTDKLIRAVLVYAATVAAIAAAAQMCGCAGPALPSEERGSAFWTSDPELYEYVEKAAERLARATERADIRMDPMGVPVVYRESPKGANGEYACAATLHKRLGDGPKVAFEIQVDIGLDPPGGKCMSLPELLVHEGIHRLNPDARHADTGIFHAQGSHESVIDEAALEALCGGFDCLAMIPEG